MDPNWNWITPVMFSGSTMLVTFKYFVVLNNQNGNTNKNLFSTK